MWSASQGLFTLRGATENKPTTTPDGSRDHTQGPKTCKEHPTVYSSLLNLRYTPQDSPTMPRKRKSTVDAGQPRRSGRSKRIAVDDGCSSTGTQSSPNLDPFACMPRDVVKLILHYLSLPDLTCCECVCKGWRDTVHWWVAAFGFRVHFPHIIWDLQRGTNTAIWEAFKVQGGYLFSLLYILMQSIHNLSQSILILCPFPHSQPVNNIAFSQENHHQCKNSTSRITMI
jgi:hypothetical protein